MPSLVPVLWFLCKVTCKHPGQSAESGSKKPLRSRLGTVAYFWRWGCLARDKPAPASGTTSRLGDCKLHQSLFMAALCGLIQRQGRPVDDPTAWEDATYRLDWLSQIGEPASSPHLMPVKDAAKRRLAKLKGRAGAHTHTPRGQAG